ncbi:PTS sugar transporter subunit IIA, partial [Enterococcus cecorum]|nr:PTS sugar transporter subunit IIA [Enterococcus cecorum]
VTILENAVKFKRMDDSSKSVNVKIILQLLFDKPDKQVTLLKELMAKVTDQNFLQKLVKEKNEENIVKLFNNVD